MSLEYSINCWGDKKQGGVLLSVNFDCEEKFMTEKKQNKHWCRYVLTEKNYLILIENSITDTIFGSEINEHHIAKKISSEKCVEELIDICIEELDKYMKTKRIYEDLNIKELFNKYKNKEKCVTIS
ncbi:MAG: hypothetical protein QXG86_02515 [Candidatus Woesearchaeota archaeon]